MKNSYQIVWNNICRERGLNSLHKQTQYLQGLRDLAKKLWCSYRNPKVVVDYNDKRIQDIYLLRYYPPYKSIFDVILRDVESSFLRDAKNIVCLAPGAGPELYGLIQSCAIKKISFNPKKVTFLDYYDWSYSSKINSKVIHEKHGKSFGIDHGFLDLNSQASILANQEFLRNADVITMQNCLNELDEQKQVSMMSCIVDLMKHGSHFILADLSRYVKLDEIINLAPEQYLQKNLRINCNTINRFMPQIVKDNLLTGENQLIPRKKMLINSLIYKKS